MVIARSLPAAAKVAGGTDARPTLQPKPAQPQAIKKTGGDGVSLATFLGGLLLFIVALGFGWLLGKRLKPRRYE